MGHKNLSVIFLWEKHIHFHLAEEANLLEPSVALFDSAFRLSFRSRFFREVMWAFSTVAYEAWKRWCSLAPTWYKNLRSEICRNTS